LYPADDSTAGVKSVTINAIDLASSTGIDSLSPGNTLVPNSLYTLSVEYQDTLANPFASVSLTGLTYATGARIWARGMVPPGSGIVIPEAVDVPLFRLSLRSEAAMGILYGVTFDIAGTATTSDFASNSIRLWLSQDSTFLATSDVPLDTATQWGTSVVFWGFSLPIDSVERHYFFTVSFDSLADATHQFSVNVLSSSSINCAGDPVVAEYWPLVREDLAVEVEIMSFEARADSLFGTLLLVWRVASERNNDGFNIWRSETPDTGFSIVANYLDNPSLEGIGDHSYTYAYQWLDQTVDIGKTYYYRLEIVSLTGVRTFYEPTASGSPLAPPSTYVLFQNRPNPFNAATTIEYIVPRSSRVWLAIYDILGRRVRTIEDGRVHRAAIYRVVWDGRNDAGGLVSSGIYFCQLRGEEGFQQTHKMLFVR
ncbi:MAG: T9SS type A sorting domain-containing protein, partial [Calditrichaeota bacterium]|nr:T9SS type A sorting domain-containing protein [Calditrichota bacterium]